MSTIIAQPGRPAHPGQHPDAAARQRRDRLARATVEDMEKALAFLSMIDPEAFEIALMAAAPPAARTARTARTDDIPEGAMTAGTAEISEIPEGTATADDEEPLPVCRHCGAPVGIFLNRGLQWQHFRGNAATSGTQEIYDPGHPAHVVWLLPDEDPDDPEHPEDF